MSSKTVGVTVKVKKRIIKYAKGVEPQKGKPFEIVEREEILRDKQAEELLERLGVRKRAVDECR